MKIVVCGAGNAAHTLVPLLGADGRHQVVVFAPLADEAQRWQALLDEGGTVEAVLPGSQRLAARPHQVTADPSTAAGGADLVLLALPAFAHQPVLEAMAPHLPALAWIGALPARGGFDWMVREVLPAHQGVVFGLQTLPWACRIRQWGRQVEVMGTKAVVDLAAQGTVDAKQVASRLGSLLALPLNAVSGFLALTLANTGQLIHPGIMYGLFAEWDGEPFVEAQIPLFYGGVDDQAAGVLQAMSDEVQAVAEQLYGVLPGRDLGSIPPLLDWLLRAYPGQIGDTSSLRSAFNTNRAYAGLRAPVQRLEHDQAGPGPERYVPWFSARYLSEDVPYSLLVSKGIAELAQVPTPAMDRVITWAQERLDKVYLLDGRVAGPDVAHSRAPQRFGIEQVEQLFT